MDEILKDDATEETVSSVLARGCKLIPNPTLVQPCVNMVDEYIPVIMKVLGEKEPKALCQMIHACV